MARSASLPDITETAETGSSDSEGFRRAATRRISRSGSAIGGRRFALKELMEYLGHSDLQMVQRYTKLLPQPDETDPAERLNAYLAKRRRRRAK